MSGDEDAIGAGEFKVPESRASGMAANFLFVLVQRNGGSLTIPAKIWNRMVGPDVQVHLKADRNGNVTAYVDRDKIRRAKDARRRK